MVPMVRAGFVLAGEGALNMVPALDLRRDDQAKVDHVPANLEAEQALLGALLYDNSAYETLPDGLRAEHFYEPFHQRMFAELSLQIGKGHLADPILLSDRFAKDEAFTAFGGVVYLADLVDRAPPAVNAPDYARQIIDLAMRRAVLAITQEAAAAVVDPEDQRSAREHVESIEGALYSLAETGKTATGFVDFATALSGALAQAAEAFQREGGIAGISTGLIDLDQKIGGLHGSDLVILAARPSMGKAQPLGANILMRDGSWKRMGDLRLGDELASTDGAPSRVAGVYPQGERQVYRVTFSDGRSALACGEHLWAVKSCKFGDRMRILSTDTVRELLRKETYQRRLSVPMVTGHFGFDDGLLIDPWLLGAMIGNGCMTAGHLSISTADAATLYRVQQAVGHDCVMPSGEAGYDYRLRASGLRDALRHYGLFGSGSAEKFIPAPYMRASRETRLELLRGLMDTDGWVEEFGAVRYCTTSPRLAEDVAALVRSVGGVCTISSKSPRFTHKGERRDGQKAYVLNIGHPERSTLISLKRKQRRCEQPMRFRAPSILSITPESVEPVQCIRVTHPSALYVTDDYIVTHNTSLACNIAFDIARKYAFEVRPDGTRKTTAGGVVAFFSLEMSAEQLALRLVSEVSGVSGDKIRKGKIDATEFGRIRDASLEIDKAPLYIDATGGISLGKLAARARRLKRLHGLDAIFVDYLQLMTGDKRYGGGQRVQEVSEITVGLKALAKELNVPVIALSQLSRQVEQREDKKPQLSDLRESGSIEQDADMVMFIYREEYYLARTEPNEGTPEHAEWLTAMDAAEGVAEVIIGKQRHGPIGTVRLAFDADLTKFSDQPRNLFHGGRKPHGDD